MVVLTSIAVEVIHTEVVAEDEEHVGTTRSGRLRRRRVAGA
jgi:hypothetical protein